MLQTRAGATHLAATLQVRIGRSFQSDTSSVAHNKSVVARLGDRTTTTTTTTIVATSDPVEMGLPTPPISVGTEPLEAGNTSIAAGLLHDASHTADDKGQVVGLPSIVELAHNVLSVIRRGRWAEMTKTSRSPTAPGPLGLYTIAAIDSEGHRTDLCTLGTTTYPLLPTRRWATPLRAPQTRALLGTYWTTTPTHGALGGYTLP